MSLEQLKQIGAELRARREAREADERAAREEAARREREARAFELAVLADGPITPLPDRGRLHLRPRPPTPEPRQRVADEQAALLQAWSDEFDVDSLLQTDAELSYRREGIAPETLSKLRRGHWALQGQLDLHGLRRDEARERLGRFLHEAVQRGWRCVRVVHGKGHGSPGKEGILRLKTRRWLVQHEQVLAFVQARPAEGGAGALVVLLQG